jgi:hypothetical protein
MIKVKAPQMEIGNHSADNPALTMVTPKMVLDQMPRYNHPDEKGNLYGAIFPQYLFMIDGHQFAI